MGKQAVAAFNDKYHDGEFADPALTDPREEAAKAKKWELMVIWPLLLDSLSASWVDHTKDYFKNQGSQLNLIQNTSTLKSPRKHYQYQNFLRALRQELQKYAQFNNRKVCLNFEPLIVDTLRCIVNLQITYKE